jgi:hypothetical protein
MTIFEQTLADLGPEVAQTVLSGLDELDRLEWQQELMCAELDAIRADIEAAIES